MIMLIKTRLTLADIDVMVSALQYQLSTCVESRLDCVDPPQLTAHYLYTLGYGEYTIRKLWTKLSRGLEIPLYSSSRSRFTLVIEQRKGVAYHDMVTGIPLDEIDCRKLKGRCKLASNANKIYIFLAGGVEDNVLRVNITRLLFLLERDSRLGKSLLSAVKLFLEDRARGAQKLLNVLLRAVRNYKGLLATIDPSLAVSNVEDLVALSPLLRLVLFR